MTDTTLTTIGKMKTEFKHTPGPWIQSNSMRNWILAADERQDICKISEHFDDVSGTYLANAKLIAAAPELLEALQNCMSVLKSFGADDEWIQVIEANKAINKATL